MTENYFKLLGLGMDYDLDREELKSKYLQMQMQFHPDRAKDEEEKRVFLEYSMKINEAEKVLKDDYLRAEYMLKLSGVSFDNILIKNVVSKDYLEEVMTVYDMIDVADGKGLKSIIENSLISQQKIIYELEDYFKQNNLTKALDLTLRLKYLANLIKNIKSKINPA